MDEANEENSAPAEAPKKSGWKIARARLRRVIGIVLTVAIFVWILKPIVKQWDDVRGPLAAANWWEVIGASALFATFLFCFRALVWRRLLKNFGYKLPVWPATRIWSTSELARYLPGSIWQVVGRVYLAKPYGVRGSVVSTSQIMELALYLLANLIVAVCSLAYFMPKLGGQAKIYMYAALALVPLLSLLLHPKIFYAITDYVLVKLNKPPIEKRMRWKSLIEVLLWNILGLIAQGLVIYVVVTQLLHIPIQKWWLVTGAYCLAWCAGFLAFLSPGGLGVREVVFIGAMSFALKKIRHVQTLNDEYLLLLCLGVILRIWATVGELLLAGLAYAMDWRGAMMSRDPKQAIVET